MSKTSNAPPVLMLVGPTASGKSAAAMRLAQTAAIEIISVDSAQVYRGMDVGTAKPSMAEREQVRHHLIDLVDPVASYSAAQFAEDTERLIDEIRSRNHHPVLVGGTMMYIKALTQGLNTLPSADPAIRERLDALAAQVGWPDMHRQLAKHDPETAARLSPNDSQRIQRALEVIEITGHPMSALLAQPAPAAADKHRFAMISLEPSNRAILHQRIAERFHAMIEQGLIDEVRALRKREDLHVGLPSIRCVGYRQIWQWIDAGESADQLSSAIDAAIAATRQLAKRQLTWLRNSTDRTIIDSNATDATEQAVEVARKLLNCSTP